MKYTRSIIGLALATLGAQVASGQTFQSETTLIPQGAPHNMSSTENVDFGDVDGDGDLDAIFADGGDGGNDRNRLWLNMGGLQGGLLGEFKDRTNQRLPTGSDTSRDIEFVDIDRDGDLDIYSSNTSTVSNQSNRWWVNAGGLQGGTEGFFVDETSTRWVNLGVNNGTTASSIAPTLVFPTGGFIDFSCDCDFADLDNDGDLDLAHSSYGGLLGGQTPTRLFLNDGLGNFEEFNPSGLQLAGQDIADGQAGLWCEGTQTSNTVVSNGTQCDVATIALDVDLADHDGDFDIDMILGERTQAIRMFNNRSEENGGALGFRDVTGAVFPPGYSNGGNHYEQEWGDLDGDGDLDLYGINWRSALVSSDVILENLGGGVYGNLIEFTGESVDGNEADFLDYDQDGDLDVFVANFSGPSVLYRNDGGFSFVDVTAAELGTTPIFALDADAADVDGDGDTDVFMAMDMNAPNLYQRNLSQVPDTTPPTVPAVEQVADRAASPQPTVVRAHVLDNAPYYVTWYQLTELEYAVDGGPFTAAPMLSSGGQVFRGEIPGALVGAITYRVRTTDMAGNVGLSSTSSYAASGCAAGVTNYCTAGTSASGCQALLVGSGTPSLAAASGFVVSASALEGGKDGLFYYGFNGTQANAWGNGSSFQCVVPPVKRAGLLAGGGTPGACDGSLALDLNTFWSTAAASKLPTAGQQVALQLWYRDPASTSNQTTSLSDGLLFTVCP